MIEAGMLSCIAASWPGGHLDSKAPPFNEKIERDPSIKRKALCTNTMLVPATPIIVAQSLNSRAQPK